MKKFLIILTFLISTIFFTNNVSALSATEEPFIDNFNTTWDKYYSVYIDRDNKVAKIYGGVKNLNNPTKTINLTTYPYLIGWVTNYSWLCYSSKPFYYNESTHMYRTDDTFYCQQTNLSASSETNFNYNYTYADNYEFVTNYDIYTQDGVLYNEATFNMNVLPTIDISKENETTVTIEDETYISSVTLNIKFSMIDNEKYLYTYKYGINSDWATITLNQSDSFTRTFNYNDTLYVQVLDRETNEVVSSSTFSINSINYDFRPYVEVNETTPTACFFYKNGQNYTICKNLNIVGKNLEDGNYISSYSYNATDWTNFENTNLTINENTTIYFRIINYITNEVSYTSNYTVSSIDTDISDLGVFNTYSSTYDKDTSFITAYINIYNLLEPVEDNYKIYYSFNSTSFIDITLLLNDMTNYYQFEINNINENKTIYFKITDLNDNILYTSTYNINYQVQSTENSGFFTDFRTNFHGLSDIISTPLYAIKKLNKGVCSPLDIPIPYTDKSISLPCMTTVYQNSMPVILNIWQIVTNGIISYYIILDLFRIVKSFKEPEEDKIEVVNL